MPGRISTLILLGALGLTAVVVALDLTSPSHVDDPVAPEARSAPPRVASLSPPPASAPPAVARVGGTLAPPEPPVATRAGTIARLEAVADRVRTLAPDDQAGLDRLYEETARLIREDEGAFRAHFAARMARAEKLGLKESFFLIKALSTNLPRALPEIVDLLARDVPAEASPTIAHSAMTDSDRLDLVKTYALENVMTMDRSGASTEAQSRLRQAIVETARVGRDLALVRQSMQALIRGYPDGRAAVAEIARQRPASERFAYADLVAGAG